MQGINWNAISARAVACFRKRHLVLSVIGLIFPLLWIIGALLPPAARRA